MSKPRTHMLKRLIRRLSPLTAAGLAAALLSVQPGAATASAPDPQPVDLAVSSYAADYSVSLTEAQRRLDRIQPIQEILASIRDLETARLAGWGIDHGANFGGWVWLTGDNPPTAAAARTAAAHADVVIRTGADHSHAELLAAQQGLFRGGAVGRVNDGEASGVAAMVTFTGIDMAANAVRIGINPALAAVPGGLTDTAPATMTDEAFQTKAAQITAQLAGTISVNYIVEDGRGLSPHANFMGGERVGDCTSGFAARQRGTGVYGIITAGHCDNQPFDMHNVTLALVTRLHGPFVDAQFLSIPTGSSYLLLDDFVCSDGRTCDVKRDIARSRMMGDYVCHYGRGSRQSCGTIDDINFYPSSPRSCENICSPTFVHVSGALLKSCVGDSGGPWFNGGVAYGIHGGGTGGDDCISVGQTSYFSAIRYVESRLGVDILTRGNITVR